MKRIQNLSMLHKRAKALRRTSATAIVHSGSDKTIYGCLCGVWHTCATNYRRARHVTDWICDHDNDCEHLYRRMMNLKNPEFIKQLIDNVYSDDNH